MRSVVAVMLLLGWSATPAVGQSHPVKLAGTARFDLSADAAVGSLNDGKVVAGDGSAERMNWVPEADRLRGYTVNFPITHFGWSQHAMSFTPAGSGTVTLTLMGPWEQASCGAIYRQEVLWDAARATGTPLANGSFEEGGGETVSGWRASGGTVQPASDAVQAVDGKQYARTWHNQTLATTLKVTAGQPVTLRLHARARVPEGFLQMRRVAERNTPAHQAAKRFLRGTNLGNYLEAPPGQNWGASYSADDFRHIRAEGFDHVRLPIAWHHHTGPAPEFRLSDEIMAKADFLVNEALKNGLNVIVNVHHFDEFTSKPAVRAEKFYAIWRQVAAHYAETPAAVVFELLNEPKDAATTEALNPIYAEAIRQIRRTNPQRTILVGPGRWNQVSELPQLHLPDDDLNLIVTVHCYDPFPFTHQGASWTGPDTRRLTGICYPGPPDEPLVPDPALKLGSQTLGWLERYNTLPTETNPCSPRAFRGAIERAQQWSDYYGRPVHMGEFGCYIRADAGSRARFYQDFRAALDEAGIGWAMWDWKAGFKYWDDKTDQPAPGMRVALFSRANAK
jgi:endoglucanase